MLCYIDGDDFVLADIKAAKGYEKEFEDVRWGAVSVERSNHSNCFDRRFFYRMGESNACPEGWYFHWNTYGRPKNGEAGILCRFTEYGIIFPNITKLFLYESKKFDLESLLTRVDGKIVFKKNDYKSEIEEKWSKGHLYELEFFYDEVYPYIELEKKYVDSLSNVESAISVMENGKFTCPENILEMKNDIEVAKKNTEVLQFLKNKKNNK